MIGRRHDYWVVRYLPHPVRGEFAVIGVIAGTGSDWAALGVPERQISRAREFGTQATLDYALEYLDRVQTSIAADELDGVQLENDRVRMNSTVQLSPPLPVLGTNAGAAARFVHHALFQDVVPTRAAPAEVDTASNKGDAI